VELAGVERDRIDVECIEGRRVLLRGTRDSPRPADTDAPLSVHALEIDEGPFRREIDLPEPVDVERIDARHRQGYLWIRLPKIIRS
jgi:HSP20 family molecular chaperone IbpA